jgi:hypothetical protein
MVDSGLPDAVRFVPAPGVGTGTVPLTDPSALSQQRPPRVRRVLRRSPGGLTQCARLVSEDRGQGMGRSLVDCHAAPVRCSAAEYGGAMAR